MQAITSTVELEFAKMHGAGNDFMVVRWPEGMAPPPRELVRGWSDRRRGVGFDQLLILQTPREAGLAAHYRVFNADGSEVEQCGNGVRCVARYLAGDGQDATLILGGPAGAVEARLLGGGEVAVNLGVPDFAPAAVPLRLQPQSDRYRLALDSGAVQFGAVSLGNPHAVVRVDSVDAAPVGILGAELQRHPSFPDGVNVGFVEVLDSASVRLRVLERGTGETRACGTGAAAAVAVGRLWRLLDEAVRVALPGGTLTVRWPGPGQALWLSGPATRVFEGRIQL